MRLHGRNAAQWWRHDKSEDRYNYLYSGEELQEFADIAGAAKELVKKSYLYTNNHFSAKSVVNAVMLKAQLGQPIEGEYPPELVERYPEIADLVATSPRGSLRRALLHGCPSDDVVSTLQLRRRRPCPRSPGRTRCSRRSQLRRRRRDVTMYIWLSALRGSPVCASADGAELVRALRADFRDADRLAAAAPFPTIALLCHVARLRIAELDDEAGHDSGARAGRCRSCASPAPGCARPSSAPRSDRSRSRTCPSSVSNDDRPARRLATAAAPAAPQACRRLTRGLPRSPA